MVGREWERERNSKDCTTKWCACARATIIAAMQVCECVCVCLAHVPVRGQPNLHNRRQLTRVPSNRRHRGWQPLGNTFLGALMQPVHSIHSISNNFYIYIYYQDTRLKARLNAIIIIIIIIIYASRRRLIPLYSNFNFDIFFFFLQEEKKRHLNIINFSYFYDKIIYFYNEYYIGVM